MNQFFVCIVYHKLIQLRIALKRLFASDATNLDILLILAEPQKDYIVEYVPESILENVDFWQKGMIIQKPLS